MRGLRLFSLLSGTLALSVALSAAPLKIVWPTPNEAWAQGRPPRDWLQHAGSGEPESGGFGGVRSGGSQFHEGLDIRPVGRDRSGSPTDPVFAAMAGVVRHVNPVAGESSYGRYIVIEHTDASPAVYTLYAHLAKIAPGIRAGTPVTAGQEIALMGHSSGGYMLPKERAHLHFEVGVAVTNNFQAWYGRQKFGSRNEHGMWNGMNLLGLNPLECFNFFRSRPNADMKDFIAAQPTVVRIRVATLRTPDFVTRYPALLTKPLPMGPVGGWEIRFNWTGVPIAWTPLTGLEVAGLVPNRPQILEVDAEVERRERSKSLAVNRRGAWTMGKDLDTVLDQLFGW